MTQAVRQVMNVRGQGLVEYGLIAALSSLLTVVWLVVFVAPYRTR